MTYPNTTTVQSEEPIKMTISERRATYPLQERIKIYNPDSMARKLNQLDKQRTKLVVHGVNILNKISIDSDTAMSRIKQRRETHNRVERRRRDNLNTLVNELSDLVPRSCIEKSGGEKCHRAKVLKYAIEYIKTIQGENTRLQGQLGIVSPGVVVEARNNTYCSESSSSSSEDSDTPALSSKEDSYPL
ncbi:hypothetical protein HPULCUR_011325 [Helicostylum pulchrum]|uniref:BHLH domain-containing protein n=1 Tax=Helicostylum pulchrum TaxID=562976 RepID=A0ABP9YFQ9_9FUNG